MAWETRLRGGRKVAGEYAANDGHDPAAHATHIIMLTDRMRSGWAGKPLRHHRRAC